MLTKPWYGWSDFQIGTSPVYSLSYISLTIPFSWLESAIEGLNSDKPFTVTAEMEPGLVVCEVSKDCSHLIVYEGAKNLLLGNAIKDARQKASVLAEASRVVLKEIQSIDYSWGELRFESRPEMIGMAPEGVLEDLRMDIEPDDIDATDNVTVVWAIE